MLCCTVGAGSFLDNSNKSSLNNKKNRNSSKQMNMDQKVPSIKEEESVQEQQVLDTSTHIIKSIQPTDTPPIPSPISPQSSKVSAGFVTILLIYSCHINRTLSHGYYLHYPTKIKKRNVLCLILMKH